MDLRALVVCPDDDAATLLTNVLTEFGLAPERAASVPRGIELLNAERYDLIILDYRADKSSEEFLARMRQSSKNRASMLIAVVDSAFNPRPVFGLGANFVLYRPLSSERTRISLRAACGLVRRERRRGPRTPVSSTANVAYPGGPALTAVLADLSDSGTLLHAPSRLPATCKGYFEFALPGQTQLVRLSGEVAWQDSSGRTGIRFLDVPQASRRLIQTWLQQNGAQAGNGRSSQGTSGDVSSTPLAATDVRNSGETKPEAKDSKLVSNAGNRRGELRLHCKLGAEVYRVGSSVPHRCTLSDISEGGCYAEMPSPLTAKSGVEIVVRTADTKLRIRGEVLATHPGFGMGIRFTFRDSAEQEEVLRLLAVLSAGPTLSQHKR